MICELRGQRPTQIAIQSATTEHAHLRRSAARSTALYLKELHSDDSEHELQKVGDQHDIADRLNGYYHAFHYILAIGRFGMKR